MVAVHRKQNSVLEEARRLYDLGYDVHWISPAVVGDRKTGKKPVGDWSRGERYAWSRLEETYRGTYNLGFQPGITSLVRGRQLIVVDFDYQDVEREDEGRRELLRLFDQVLAPTVRTGSGLGEHYHLLVPRGVKVLHGRVLWAAGSHCEIRVISTGGNAVLPPSVHWSGESYEWGDRGAVMAPGGLTEKLAVEGEGESDLDVNFELGTVIDLRGLRRAVELQKRIRDGVGEGERSEALYWVIAELWKRGISREDILATLLSERYGISAKYLEAGRRSITRARMDIARVCAKLEAKADAEKSQLTKHLDEFNRDYCHVVYGDSTRVAYQEDGEVKFMREGAFTSIHSHLAYMNAGGVRVDPGKIWMGHPETKVYYRVGFDPSLPPYRESDDLLNLWLGFATPETEEGSCALFHEHLLRNVSDGDEVLYAWLWNWITHMIQRPWEKPGTAVVLQGPTGVGKTVVADVLCGLIGGAHAMSTSNPDLLAGKFNKLLGNKLFVAGEEVSWGGDARGNAILRDRVTSTTLQLEPKGVDAITVRSCHRFMLITNESWPVNVLAQERRYALFQVGKEHQKDQMFFGALLKEMGNGGLGRMMWELRRSPLNEEWVRTPPVTGATREQQERSLGSVSRWIHDCLGRGWFYHDREETPGWRVRVDPDRMLAACKGALGRRGEYVTGAELRAELRAVLGEIELKRLSGTTKRGWKLPKTLSVARSLFDAAMGTPGDWNE